MNPFDLPGPQFLLFYACFTAVALLIAALLTQRAEDGAVPQIDLSDPYRLAYLRGQTEEAIRVAVMALTDRRLLAVEGGRLTTVGANAADLVRHPLEHAILQQYEATGDATDLFKSTEVEAACNDYERELQARGLLPDRTAAEARRQRAGLLIALLLSVAAIRIAVALSRGRHNLLFLVVLAGLASYGAYRVTHPVLTVRGRRLLADLKTLFGGLRQRGATLAPGSGTAEAALLAAVFGLEALPNTFVYVQPRRSEHSGVSGCGGGGCGGGGCGGGCGGCGG